MATPPDRMKMRNNPVNGKKKKKRKVIKGIRADQPATPRETTQATPRVAGTPQALKQTFKSPGYTGKTTQVKRKKALPLSAAAKGVTGRVGKATLRRSGVTAHERGLVIKPQTYKGAGKPLDKGKSKLRKKKVNQP